jgi:hypothetical protein
LDFYILIELFFSLLLSNTTIEEQEIYGKKKQQHLEKSLRYLAITRKKEQGVVSFFNENKKKAKNSNKLFHDIEK